MKKISIMFAVLAMAGSLSACGQNRGDRALSGGGIGAGVGALGAAVTGGDVLTGAVVGGAVGAAGGAVTDSRDIDLGRPVWRGDEGRQYNGGYNNRGYDNRGYDNRGHGYRH